MKQSTCRFSGSAGDREKRRERMTQAEFTELVGAITAHIAGRTLDGALEADLNGGYSPSSAIVRDVLAACRAGIDEGWMCNREAGGIRYGRVVKPGPATHGFSVDVVEMNDIAGPHHRHPNGEIDVVMPLDRDASFDGHGPGWIG